MKYITFEEAMELAKLHPEQYEVRVEYYGGLVLNSETIKCIKFDIEMREHFKQRNEEHKLMMYALELRLDK